MELTNLQKLADELIELRCDTHSVGNVYEYLLKACGDANKAKADFIRFLAGDLPRRMVEAAAEWICIKRPEILDEFTRRPRGPRCTESAQKPIRSLYVSQLRRL
jgi:hypothetical protein